MALTAQQANDALATVTNPDQLRALIDQISVEATGKATILYSGTTANGVSNAAILQGMLLNGEDIRIIDKTEAAKFLDVFDQDAPGYNKALADKLEIFFGDKPRDQGSAANQFLFGEKIPNGTPEGTRLPNGVWDAVSSRFVDETVGEVRTLTGGAPGDRIFGQTEVPRALANDKITTIDGILRSDLAERSASDAFKAITAQSDVYSAELKVALNADGTIYKGASGQPIIESRNYFGTTGIDGKPPAVPIAKSGNLSELMPDRFDRHLAGAEILQSIKSKWEGLATAVDSTEAIRANAKRVLEKLGWAGDLLALGLTAKEANAAYAQGDVAGGDKIVRDWALDMAGGLAGGLLASKLVGSALLPLYLTGPAGALIAGGLTLLAGLAGGVAGSYGAKVLADTFSDETGATGLAGTVVPRRDPLVLDLDGDGIETRGRNEAPILFDHDADGVKTGTGWVKPDDGWLVMDRNANGTIDSGRELFGVDTYKSNGQLATDGFDALKDLDTNADGKVDSQDSAFANLRIWRDLNQDGTSQAGELLRLSDYNIASIGVNASATRVDLGNGNIQTAAGTFTRGNGTTGSTGETDSAAANLDLLVNTFYRQFSDVIPYTDQALLLPDLRGSGRVRDLKEAISLSPDLGNVVSAYTLDTTRQGQLDKLDAFIEKWADTSDMLSLKTQAANLAGSGVSVTYNVFGLTAGTPAYDAFLRKLGIVERFMGFTYGGANGQARLKPLDANSGQLTVSLAYEQINAITLAYDRFKGDIYESLLLATRLSGHLNALGLTLVNDQIKLDFDALESSFQSVIASDARGGVVDLIEFVSAAGKTRLRNLGWDVIGFLSEQLNAAPDLGAFSEELSEWTVRFIPNDLPGASGGSRPDLILGSVVGEGIHGQGGNDLLLGRAGNDTLSGDAGDDTLDGGAGNDMLLADAGNNTYLFGMGDGQDLVRRFEDLGQGKINTLQLKPGVTPNDLVLRRVADSDFGPEWALEVGILGTNDKITFNGFFVANDTNTSWAPLQNIVFDDGTIWDKTAILARLYGGTEAADAYIGTVGGDVMNGQAGHDTLYGRSGNDSIYGGTGNDYVAAEEGEDLISGGSGDDTLDGRGGMDTLSGGEGNDLVSGDEQDDIVMGDAGNDTVNGGSGNDLLTGSLGDDSLAGGAGDDTLDGGTGNDVITESGGNNIVVFGIGDGQDLFKRYSDMTAGRFNVLQIGPGINPEDLQLRPVFDSEFNTTYALEVSVLGTTDKITFNGFFYNNDVSTTWTHLQQIRFDDGTIWDLSTIVLKAMSGAAGNDNLTGTAGDNLLTGQAGDDTLKGGLGNDTILGGEDNDSLSGDQGNDFIFGEAGNDTLIGDVGNDQLFGAAGNDTLIGDGGSDQLDGGEGIDSLSGGEGNDILRGGAGNDVLVESFGNNTFVFGTGDGQDLVKRYSDMTAGRFNVLQIGPGINPEDLQLRPVFNSDSNAPFALEVSIRGTSDKINFDHFFYNYDVNSTWTHLQQIRFNDGTTWDLSTIVLKALSGTADNDSVTGTPGDNLMKGQAGNDTLKGAMGNDTIFGGEGNDSLSGDQGNDLVFGETGNDTLIGDVGNDQLDGGEGIDSLSGGEGNDTLQGGAGNDVLVESYGNNTFVFGAGDGQDLVKRYSDTTAGRFNVLQIGPGIKPADLQLRPVFDSEFNTIFALEVSVLGTTDKITFNGFFYNNDVSTTWTHLQQIRFDDGTIWDLSTIVLKALSGTADNDNFTGTPGNDLMMGQTGNDTLNGRLGHDVLIGGDGNDNLSGDDGNDTLDGGSGINTLSGGSGNDRYQITRSAGIQSIQESLNSSADVDTVEFDASIKLTDLIATKYASSVALSLTDGTSINFSVSGAVASIENFAFQNDGQVYTYAQISKLLFNSRPTGEVTINGQATQGTRLTAANNLADADGLGTVSYQWMRNGIFTGITGSEFVLSQSDVGYQISTVASYIDGAGRSESVTSVPTSKVANVNDLPEGGIFINGDPQQGSTLSAQSSLTDVDGMGVLSYQWLRNGVAIGSTGETYVLSQADVGAEISVLANYTDGQGGQESVLSARTQPVRNVNDVPTGSVIVSGNPLEDQMLRATSNLVDPDGLGQIAFQWLRDGVATNKSGEFYVLGQADVGKKMSVFASYTDGQGTPEAIVSGQTAFVTNVNDTPTGTLNIIGTPTEGQTLRVEHTLADEDGLGNLTFRWLRDGGETGSLGLTYVLANADVGTKISVVAAYTDGQGCQELVVSAATNAVVRLNQYIAGTATNDVLTGGAGDDTLLGAGGNDTLSGGLGNDSLDGGAGSDSLVGGSGNDVYSIDATSDVISEFANEGTDHVNSSVTYTLTANVENLTLQNASAINGTGNNLDNILTGNAGANTLTGGTGNDTLVGGASNDTLVGGAGNDAYVIDVATDVITENLNEGTDTVFSPVTFSIAALANLEHITLTGSNAVNATGNAKANVLTGNASANTLNGGVGADTMMGGAGNDTYVVDNIADIITEGFGEGMDLVQSSATYTLAENIENLTLTTTSAINGTGNGLDNLLVGNSAVNTINGAAGNDTLDGGAGADSLIGGAGNDTYIVDSATEKLAENLNEGTDTVQTLVTWTLATNFENLTLMGTSAINGTGNASDNLLIGNGAVNTLTGGAGNDTLDGGAGADSLVGGSGNDLYFVNISTEKLSENANEGTDTVRSSVTWTLAANFENLSLDGTSAINATGNTSSNALTGNGAANTLVGGGGNDVFQGGLGADTLNSTSTTSNDVYIWGRGEGADTLTDTGGVDRLQFLSGVTAEQVWLRQVGSNLEVSIIGTTDKFTVNNWYTSAANQVESLKLSDGRVLNSGNVQNLVSAMSSFAVPPQGQTTLPSNYQSTLNPVITANWG